MPNNAENSTLDYFDFLNLVDRLYPEAAGADMDEKPDRQRLIDWAAAVTLFQTRSASDADLPVTTDTEPGNDLWLTSTYHHLLTLVSRRYSTAPDPQEARYRFDYGREYRQRTAIREDLRKLFCLIENFYRLNTRLLVTKAPVESPATATDSVATSHELPKPNTVESVPVSIQSEVPQPIPEPARYNSTPDQQTNHSPPAFADSKKILATDNSNSAPDRVEAETFETHDKEETVEYTELKSEADDAEQIVDMLLHDLFIDG